MTTDSPRLACADEEGSADGTRLRKCCLMQLESSVRPRTAANITPFNAVFPGGDVHFQPLGQHWPGFSQTVCGCYFFSLIGVADWFNLRNRFEVICLLYSQTISLMCPVTRLLFGLSTGILAFFWLFANNSIIETTEFTHLSARALIVLSLLLHNQAGDKLHGYYLSV